MRHELSEGGGKRRRNGIHLICRRERKELRPWSFIFALWAGDDGVVVIVHRHRYVRLPTLRTAASDGYDHIFGHVILLAQNIPKRSGMGKRLLFIGCLRRRNITWA